MILQRLTYPQTGDMRHLKCIIARLANLEDFQAEARLLIERILQDQETIDFQVSLDITFQKRKKKKNSKTRKTERVKTNDWW
jgi:hypothetical protein